MAIRYYQIMGHGVRPWTLPNPGTAYITQMVATANGTVYAADNGNGMLEQFIPGNVNCNNQWTGNVSGGGSAYSSLYGLCLLPNGNLLTSDAKSNLLQEYAP